MKAEPQRNAELTRLRELIDNMSVAMLTSLEADGRLVSRPMAPLEMDDQGALWFFTDLRSAKVEQLGAVNVSFSDLDKGTYVSISGRGRIDTDRTRIEQLWTPMVRPWFPDGPESTHLGLLEFVPDSAEFWDAPHSKMVRLFTMAVSVVAGKPIGMGEHDTLTDLSKRSPDTVVS